MNATLLGLQADQQTATSERARAVEEALAALQTHLSGGWDSVDESGSAAITRWLDSSRFLFDVSAPVTATPAADAKLMVDATLVVHATGVVDATAPADATPAIDATLVVHTTPIIEATPVAAAAPVVEGTVQS
ncbi:MAG: hypothetical protein JWN44_5637 [Myxococcales bacterium]|nr:hypothetical protein [Myxococcales bacterium]